jgi:predicted lipoprotein
MKNLRLLSGIVAMLFLLTVGIMSCKKDDPEPVYPTDTFDRTALLTNFADSIIVPQYLLLDAQLDSLAGSVASFNLAPDLAGLYTLRAQFQVTYRTYQSVSMFEFGPAEVEVYRMNCNTFPTDTAQIILNISNGTYDLFLASNMDAKGYPGIDYLLYGRNVSDVTIVNYFTSTPTRRTYLADLISHLRTHTQNVLTAWTTTHTAAFIASDGNDIGSSLGYLVNQLNYDLELIKNAKIGIPLGKQSLGVPFPEKCENYYSSQSIYLATAALDNIENCYLGRSFNGNNGPGFDDYLDHLGAQYQSGTLNSAIQAHFQDAKMKLQAVPDPLSIQVVNNQALVDTAYVALRRLTILLKTDMPSNLGIVITYQDTDGD